MADRQLRARVSEEIVSEVERIATEIEKNNPGAEANVSTVVRFATNDYIKRYNARANNEVLFIELPIKEATEKELEIYLKALKDINKHIGVPSVKDAIEKLEKAIFDWEFEELKEVKKLKQTLAKTDWVAEGEDDK